MSIMTYAHRQVFLFVVAVLPVSLSAQIGSTNIQSDTSPSTVAMLSTDGAGVASGPISISNGSVVVSAAPIDQSTPPTKPSKPTKTQSDSDQPPIQGSMVGYIDNAVVGSEIRVRFDAGFGDNVPDRAEFFYAQCGCDGGTAKGPQPGLATDLNFQQLYLRGEYAPKKFLSFIFEVPFRAIQTLSFAPASVSPANPGFGNQAGLSDIQAGVKLAALSSAQQYLTFQLVGTFPTGDSTKGLGTDHYSVAPSLLYYRKVSDHFSLEGQVGDSHPIGGDTPGFAGDVFDYGIGPSYVLYESEKVRTAAVLEMVGWRILGGMENNAALLGVVEGAPLQSVDGMNIVNLKGGFRTSFGNHNSFYVGYGHAVTHEVWYKQIVRVEYRRSF